ncbi:NADH-quinone oxidoreductase subunit NuoB [Myxococcota bacterium]|jgi:NADH-quinone oxidoreductase subunit B|nr:NADH-quinone oxidoreductase subunit NuoB [Myxococcota bacterium]
MGLESNLTGTFVGTRLSDALNWARKYSLFQYPFVTACCGMEFMSAACSHYDISRFGAEIPRFSPRQADLLFVVGTVSHKLAPVLRKVYDQMCDPKWVVSFGACASSGGFYDNYCTVQGIDTIIPVDVYIPGCPPRPEQVLDALIMLQEKIQREPLEKQA